MNKERIIRLLEEQNRNLLKQLDHLTLELSAMTKSMESLEKALLKKDKYIEKLVGKNQSLNRMFAPKSEKVTPVPAPAQTSDPQGNPTPQTEKNADATRKARGNNGAKRKEYFNLETREHDIWPEVEGFDPALAKILSTTDSIRYQYIPPRFIKNIYHQHQCIWKESILAGKLPCTPLLNSNYDASVIAGMLQLRYIYSMPVERIVKFFTESGMKIDKATAHGLIKKAATMFDLFDDTLKAAVLEDDYINMDESYYTVLERSPKSTTGKKSSKAYIWAALARKAKLVHFFYNKGSRARSVLTHYVGSNYRGAIQTDGLENYKILETEAYPDAIRLACFQHCKRKFLDIKGNKNAEKIAGIINKLYQKEHQREPDWPPEKILAYREEYATPILKELKQELLKIQSRKSTLPKSNLGKAVNYTLNQYEALCNYIKQPDYDLDNNAIERIMRYISLSRKNSLFAGSHEGAKRTALIYSLACSCRLHDINSFDYFTDILQKLIYINPTAKPEEVRHLLPDKWER